jgi:hypothetical protein
MGKNEIGLLADDATRILDAISKLRFCIKEKLTLDGRPMSEGTKASYEDAIEKYIHYTNILRLVQGWEIDCMCQDFLGMAFISMILAPYFCTLHISILW